MKYKGLLVTDLSGTAGGIVASHNKAGGYLRAYVTPTNPNTAIQAEGRARFGSASAAWHGLTDAQKADWNMFALTNFKPQRGVVLGVTYAGFNAFVALRNTAMNAQSRLDSGASISTPAVTATYGTYSAPFSSAPTSDFAGIPTVGGAPRPISITTATMTAGGVLTVDLQLSGGLPILTAPSFVDNTSGQGFGIGVYASMPSVQANQFKQSPGFTLLSTIGQPTISSGWSTSSTFTISLDVPSGNIAKHKVWYGAGEVVRLTMFAISATSGQSAPLGAVDVVIS